MIRKGKYDWYSPDQFLRDEAKSVFNRLSGLKDLPPLPTSVAKLQQLVRNPEVSPRHLAIELRKEPLLAAQILQLGERLRSQRNRTQPQMKSIEHAIVYIGLKPLADFFASAALRSLTIPQSAFRVGEFWSHSSTVGAAAELLTQRDHSNLDPDEVYLAGTLCNLGKLATAICFPDIVTKIYHEVHGSMASSTWRTAERTYRFPDHAIIGEISASMWGMPESVLEAARLHHEVPSLDSDRPLTVPEIVAIANQLTHLASAAPHCVESPIVDAYRKRTKMADAEFQLLVRSIIKLRQSIEG